MPSSSVHVSSITTPTSAARPSACDWMDATTPCMSAKVETWSMSEYMRVTATVPVVAVPVAVVGEKCPGSVEVTSMK